MQSMSKPYKGWILDPSAHELADSTGWKAEVNVAKDDEDESIDTSVCTRNRICNGNGRALCR